MEPESQQDPAGDDLAPEHEEKEAQVLKREGLEEELMEEGESAAGEQIEDVEDVEG